MNCGRGKAQASWTPCTCEPAREAAERGRGMGYVRVASNSCHDQFRQTVFFSPPHDPGHRPLTRWVTGPDPQPQRVGHDTQVIVEALEEQRYRRGPRR